MLVRSRVIHLLYTLCVRGCIHGPLTLRTVQKRYGIGRENRSVCRYVTSKSSSTNPEPGAKQGRATSQPDGRAQSGGVTASVPTLPNCSASFASNYSRRTAPSLVPCLRLANLVEPTG